MTEVQNKSLSVLSEISEFSNFSKERQSLLLRDLEMLLDLQPSTLRSNLLALPRELRDQIFGHVIPWPTNDTRPELHTCLWGAEMTHEPWRHDIFGYAESVPKEHRLHPDLLLINWQLHDEILQTYFRWSKLTLHAELRNVKMNELEFEYSPHILQLPMLKFVTHVRFYVEWNYIMSREKKSIDRQISMTKDVVRTMDTILAPLQAVETIELSILFFWKFGTGKYYHLSMQDLFDLEDIFKRHAEQKWLSILRKNKYIASSPNPSAGVGYKLLTERKGTDQSGAMEIFVSQNLEDAMQERRRSNIDFYGNYGIVDPLPKPSYKLGAMI